MKKLILPVIMFCATTTFAAGDRIGLQTYCFKDAMSSDPVKTLELISSLGVKEVETANYADGKFYGLTPAELKATCKKFGMKDVSNHIKPFESIEMNTQTRAWWDACIAAHKQAGMKYVVMATLPIKKITTTDQLKTLCEFINQAGAMCRKQGLILGIHNHRPEFEKVDGVTIYDYLVQNTSKDVTFELDVYWAKMAGFDPIALINKYPGRITLMHVKDEAVIGASGLLDFKAIVAAAQATGNFKYYFLEQERSSGDMLTEVKQSLEFLRSNNILK